jgi:hypothetical protein
MRMPPLLLLLPLGVAAPAEQAPAAAPTELFAWFSGVGGDSALQLLDEMPGLTTLACFGWPPRPHFVAAAHAKGVKVVRAAGINTSLIHTEQGRSGIVQELVTSVMSEGADGLNIDEESYGGDPRDFTALIQGLRSALAPTGRSLSLAVSAYPINPLYKKERYRTGLNYTLAIADYLVIMGYDMVFIEPCSHDGNCSQPPAFPPLANSPLPGLKETLRQYQHLGVPASRLVMALPYFGRDYPCAATEPADSAVDRDGTSKCTILAPNRYRSGNTSLDPSGVGPWPCAGCFTHLPSSSVGEKTPFLNHSLHKHDRFTKTGSGRT